ncbi:MAG: arylsulfatase [Planctomycetales bacterium]|nr:arylsulfatase [Planctomycetales bacterium]
MRQTIQWALAIQWATALAYCLASPTTASAERPNLILIVTDDQGWGDMSCHGNPILQTPHMDALKAQGAEMTRFYVSPVCSPTRASLMTGRYNFRTGVTDTYRGHSMMSTDEITIAETLSEAGYATGIFGKWHLGDCYPMRPQDQGFAQSVVFRGGGLAQPSDPLATRNRYTDPTLWRNGEAYQAQGYCTDVYFDEAIEFIAASHAQQRPFFAYIATNAPHGPYHDVPQVLYDKYKSLDVARATSAGKQAEDVVARVFAMVENIDQNLGRLNDALDARNLTDNTLVIFMSDNGPATPRYVGNRRGRKTEVYEGGIASPFFARWPRRIEAGRECDALAAHIDIFPTLIAAAGVEAPESKIDGQSLLGLLTGESADWPERTLFFQAHRGGTPQAEHQFAVVQARWKLLRNSGFERPAAPPEAPFELFDLAANTREVSNVIAEHPEVAEQLQRAYGNWFADVTQSRDAPWLPPRIHVGSPREKTTTLSWQDWQATGPGWGAAGSWLITTPRPTRVDVEVVLEKPSTGTAVLRCNAAKAEQTITERQQVEFRDFLLPSGDSAISFELQTPGGAVPPYQIHLRQH